MIATKVTPNQEIYEVVVKHSNNTTETFKTTKEHPFWVEGIGWLKASLLEQGMTLLDKHGLPNVTIISQTKLTHTETVYNFEVQDFHTYHIGEYGVWVHNADCCGVINAFSKDNAFLHIDNFRKHKVGMNELGDGIPIIIKVFNEYHFDGWGDTPEERKIKFVAVAEKVKQHPDFASKYMATLDPVHRQFVFTDIVKDVMRDR